MEEPKFCKHCGSKLQENSTGYFNQMTGDPEKKMMCINSKCFMGCHNTGGHIFKKHGDKCEKCGQWDTYYLGG